MTCKTCKDSHSWHNWAQKPYCSPFCKGLFKETSVQGEWTRAAKLELESNIDDVVQPKRHDGTFNPHFVAVHGTKEIEKAYKVDRKEILSEVERYG